jgi:hypothetical protein
MRDSKQSPFARAGPVPHHSLLPKLLARNALAVKDAPLRRAALRGGEAVLDGRRSPRDRR